MSKKLLFNFNREVIQNYTYVKYVGAIITATNTLEKPIKSAILKGNTKYRDIDTGDILDTFDETKNLELVSVKMPVLTTSNEDGTKTNILTVNEDVTLRSNGDICDELNLLTGQLTQRIGEVVLDGSEDWFAEDDRFTLEGVGNFLPNRWSLLLSDKYPSYSSLHSITQYPSYIIGNGWAQGFHIRDVALFPNPKNQLSEFKEYLSQNPVTVQYQSATESIKTVDLMVVNQDGDTLSKIKPIEGTMHVEVSGTPINPTAVLEVPVEAITQNLNSFIGEE